MRRISLIALTFSLAACSLPDVRVQTPTISPMPTQARAEEDPAPTPLALGTVGPLTSASPAPTIDATLTNAIEQQQRLMVELYRRASPAVVRIEVLGTHPLVDDERAPSGDVMLGQGSGFLYDQLGHIVTNNHVVEDAHTLQVSFADGTTVPAELVGTDPGSDLAVVRVGSLPQGTAPLALGASGDVAVGQTAIAIGNPFGLQNTLTIGVISGLGRDLDGPAVQSGGRFSIPNIIQTDAAINPGNSGGPLLNIYGQVIGVNTAISSESGSFEGIGYAVPSDMVGRVVPQIIRTGTYSHPWLGVSMNDITPQLRRQFGIAPASGVMVVSVIAGGPAEKAGLRGDAKLSEGEQTSSFAGDIIVAVDDQKVARGADLRGYIEQAKAVGDSVTLTVLRDGAEQRLTVVLEARPK
ncbi:PDZ domain-containing protein [Chloroflexia bacterium SDU3-3]|nr:PDZ domain-containing protein [Chloroflexia bacterium SDU3-3]